MAAAGFLRFAWLSLFSKPRHERTLYRLIRKQRPKSIVEIGVGDGRRATRLIEAARRYAGERVAYTGIDPFEGRSDGGGGTLKNAFRLLRPLDAALRLVPGDPFPALARTANSLTGTDLLLIAADQAGEPLQRAWFYVPRMLHAGSIVLLEETGQRSGPAYRRMQASEIETLARAASPRRRAA